MSPLLFLIFVLLVASLLALLVASLGFPIKRTPTPPAVIYQPLGWGFWGGWVLVTAVVGSIGFLVSYFIAFAIARDPLSEVGRAMALGALFGAFMGATQVRRLRPHWANANRWLWATIGTWAIQIGGSVGLFLLFALQSHYISIIFLLPLVGMLAALPQWWVIKPHTPHAAWWLILNAGVWPISMLAAVFIALPALTSEGDVLPYFFSPWVLGSALGFVNGLLTASALVWLCRTPRAQPAAPPKIPV